MNELLLRVKLTESMNREKEEVQKEGIEGLIHVMEEHYQVVDSVSIVNESLVHLEVIRDKRTLAALTLKEPILSIRTNKATWIELESRITLDRIERILRELTIIKQNDKPVCAGVHMLPREYKFHKPNHSKQEK